MNTSAARQRLAWGGVATIAALLLALEITDAAALLKARLDRSARLWLQSVERHQRGVVRRRALARVLRPNPRG
jgi:hypothetical protein